jgi:hypothetical protein
MKCWSDGVPKVTSELKFIKDGCCGTLRAREKDKLNFFEQSIGCWENLIRNYC